MKRILLCLLFGATTANAKMGDYRINDQVCAAMEVFVTRSVDYSRESNFNYYEYLNFVLLMSQSAQNARDYGAMFAMISTLSIIHKQSADVEIPTENIAKYSMIHCMQSLRGTQFNWESKEPVKKTGIKS